MTEESQLRRAAITVCSARLDKWVTHSQFAELVEKLISEAQWAVVGEHGTHVVGPNIQLPDGAAAAPDAEQTPAPSTESGADPVHTSNRNSDGSRSTSPQKPSDGGRRRVSYDDKVRMRARYDAALEQAKEQGKQRAPRGLIDQLAADFDCSISQVKMVVYRMDGT